MKFHCDRCKTRYSIADDRVRGKILKIRCKNCSAVITVREGMDGEAAEAPAVAPPIPAARPAAARAAGSSALQGAFQAVMARPATDDPPVPRPISPSDSFRAPVHISDEWYVSVDGEQQGPFDLLTAKEWVVGRPPEEELYCWQEDFDDWLPVEKVSHFRGLRGRADTVETPPRRAPTATPPPLPAAPAAAAPGRRFDIDRPVPLAQLAARQPVDEDTPKPLFDAAMKKIEAQARAASAAEGAAEVEADPFAAVARPGSQPSKRNGSNRGLFDKVDDAGDDGEDAVDAMEFDIGEASRIVKLPMLMQAARESGAAAAAPDPAAASGGLPGVAKIPSGGVGRGTGGEMALRPGLAPLSDSALAEAQPPILTQSALPPRRSPLMLPMLIGGGVLVVTLVIVVVVVLAGGGESGPGLARSDIGGSELGGRDYRFGGGSGGDEENGTDPQTLLNQGTSGGARKRPTNNNVRSGGDTSNGTGPTLVTGPTDPSATPLQPTEVINELQRQSLGNRRCYERALKKDPFLDVKSIPVKITVDASGVVTDVTLGSHADTVLGQCLISRLRQWAFRKSTKGISMNLTLTFEQTN